MRNLLNTTITVTRNGTTHKPGTKLLAKDGLEKVYDSLPARISSMTLNVLTNDSEGNIIDIRKNDIIEDNKTQFKYIVIEFPELSGGILHHFEIKIQRFINQ